ncbi:MAG: hypothetical protein HC770_09850 [Pseudanabaena sp. CRU_2_10]|nr:hypothetical protein [Pseudanabaena sp. CRU_2_10]
MVDSLTVESVVCALAAPAITDVAATAETNKTELSDNLLNLDIIFTQTLTPQILLAYIPHYSKNGSNVTEKFSLKL